MIKTRGLLLTVLICNLRNLTHNFFFNTEVTRLLSQFYLIFLLRNGLRHYRSIAIRDRSRISQSRDLHVHKFNESLRSVTRSPSRVAKHPVRFVVSGFMPVSHERSAGRPPGGFILKPSNFFAGSCPVHLGKLRVARCCAA